jgi:hypothetical protein
MKQCKICKEEKDLTSFRTTFDKRINKEYARPSCKMCENIKYNTKEKLSKYYIDNKEKIKNYSKEYWKENYQANKESKNISRNKWRNNRKKTDNLFKLEDNLRSSIGQSFRKNGYTKKSKTQEILGCSFVEFKNYLESKFENWMDWKNRGLYNGDFNYGWDIDHIIPISSATTEEELIKLNHYTNLQPLCSKVNRDIKKDKIEYGKFRSLHNN